MSSIVGTWRLVRNDAFDADGNPVPPPYGPQPMGLAMFHADGRMMAVLADSRPGVPPGEGAYMSYTGRYQVEGDTLRTRVDGSVEPSRVGGEQVRTVSWENGMLRLAPPLRMWKGRMERHDLLWERLG